MKVLSCIRVMSVVAATWTVPAVFADEAAEKPAEKAPPQSAEQTKAAEKKTDGEKKDENANYKPLAEARALIGEIVANPEKMTEVMKTLSPEDQKTFVADVNAAIMKLPGSVEEKTAKYLNVNKAALRGAAKDNMVNILAVTFATVPPESLTVISERYAVDLFSRDAPTQKMTDAAFAKVALEVVGTVEKTTMGTDDAGVRNTLAILMFLRASGGSPEDLADKMIETIPQAEARELAKKEWIPAAMAKGDAKSYDAMLAYADAGKNPNLEIVLFMAGPQLLEACLVDITSAMDNKYGIQQTPVLDQAFGGYDENMILMQVPRDTTGMVTGGAHPRTTDPTKPWNPAYKRGDPKPQPEPTPKPEPEPKPYPYSAM